MMKGDDTDMSNTQRTRPAPHVARAEAKGEGIEIEFEGFTYVVPPSSEWDLDALEAAENGRVVTSTKLILGDAQWTEFRKRNRTMGDLERFMDAVGDVTGGNL